MHIGLYKKTNGKGGLILHTGPFKTEQNSQVFVNFLTYSASDHCLFVLFTACAHFLILHLFFGLFYFILVFISLVSACTVENLLTSHSAGVTAQTLMVDGR